MQLSVEPMPTSVLPGAVRRHERTHEHPRRRPHVLDEGVFREVLIRERKRADRSHQSVVLLLVRLNDPVAGRSSPMWESLAEALTAATRDIDVVGWFESQAVIGLIVPENRAAGLVEACDRLVTRVRREIVRRLAAHPTAEFSIRFHVYPEPLHAGAVEPWPVDPSLYPELTSRQPRRSASDAIKRELDIIGSLALLVVLSPLFALIAILVKLSSPGPVFFRQVRIGEMVKPFTMLKFRTMKSGCDPKLHREFVSSFIKAGGQASEPGTNGCFKLTDDPRITRIGHVLRRTSLDELPQLWNVLRGDMSLVGPRPALPYELEQYEPWHRRRAVEAKPGITGLWQVAARSRTTFDGMVRLDLRYARTRSVWTDIKILLATPAAVVCGKGAR